MPKRVRIELNRDGVREAALSSDEVRGYVSTIANRIADEARSKTDDEVEVTDAGQSRARSYVTRLGSGARGEAEDRALGSSIGG